MWPFRQNQVATIVIGTVGLVFFLTLTVYSYRRGARSRAYYAGLVMIVMASLSMLVRGWFFPNASPDPRTIGGLLRLASGLIVLAGGILLEREWRRQRKQHKK
jgi:hypothetical protein